MPQIILRAYPNCEDWDGNCDYAVIELDQKLVTTIMLRIALINDLQRAVSPDLFEMVYWDSHARFFSHIDPLEGLLAKVDNEEIVINKEPVHIPENALSRVECQQMLIFSDSVCWQAVVMNTNIMVETAPLTLSTIENIKKDLIPA